MGGRNTYEYIRLNLPGAVPSITSVDRSITKAGGKIVEDEFRYDALSDFQISNNYQLAICSEDCTGVIQKDPVHLSTKIRNRLLSQSASMFIGNGKISVDVLFDLIKNQSKLIHGLVKTDVYPKDRQNFSSCAKISTDDVLSALNNASDSYATQVYLRLLRSIILAYIEQSTSIIDRIYHSWITVFICRLWWTWLQLTDVEEISTEY
ncbi:unnamed protein product [Rotaria sp. Silwood2]|nr:unnamed protein product [Rotaria sp. Silwood2]CAF4336370.1 unnamed protein product [Rotaria sp. Silwood2]